MNGFQPECALEEKAIALISKHNMLHAGDKVVVGVSGGADSVALLLFLSKISDPFKLELSVFHLDHMMRGDESACDAAFVKEIASRLGVAAEIEQADVKSLLNKSGLSPQDMARRVRMERLEAFAERQDADRIALGHTADDQVETFFMRIVQGAGLSGLSGIPPVRGRIIRPFLSVWRTEIEAYIAACGFDFRTDSSNFLPVYLRNRVRLKLLPVLEEEFGKSVKETVLRIVEALSIDSDYISAQVLKVFDELALVGTRRVTLQIEPLQKLHEALRRGILREAWRRLNPEKQSLSWRHTVDIEEKALFGDTGAALDLPGGIVVERDSTSIVFRTADRKSLSGQEGYEENFPARLSVPGKAYLPWSGDFIEAEIVRIEECSFTNDSLVEFVSAQKIQGPLIVRTPVAGDRFQPLGMGGLKKVADFFTDLKVPVEKRWECPIVLYEGRIVWVAGYRIDERFKVDIEHEERAVRLRLIKGASSLIEG